MALTQHSLVGETSTSTGPGTMALAGAIVGLSAVGDVKADGETFFARIRGVSGDAEGYWELALLTYAVSGNVVTRTQVYRNSEGGTSARDWEAGTKQIYEVSIGLSDLDSAARGLLRTLLGLGSIATLPADANVFPTGTSMLFFQAAAPTGWTKQTTHNNKAIRLVTGTPSSGGSVDFSTVFGRVATDNHVLTATQIPSHTHQFSGSVSGNTGNAGGHFHTYSRFNLTGGGLPVDNSAGYNVNSSTENTSNAPNHQHSFSANFSGTTGSTGSGNAHSHNIDLRVRYVDAIICNKD
ncbi:MAG: hypothetical protein KIS96_03420 [Bauldia sp.]|nr:hypothetical protein [Bauldia sp.]